MRELFLTVSEPLCTGLTAGSQSDWFSVSQCLEHTIFIKTAGIVNDLKYRIEHCPVLGGKPHTGFICNMRVDGHNTSEIEDTVRSFIGQYRTGFIRINFLSANGGTPTIDGYIYGGR